MKLYEIGIKKGASDETWTYIIGTILSQVIADPDMEASV